MPISATAAAAVTAGLTAATQDQIKGLVTGVFSSLGNGFKKFFRKAKVDAETAFTEYLFEAQKRYGSNVKTLLYGNDPQWIYDIYEHNFLMEPELFRSQESMEGKERFATENLLDVLNMSRNLIITGTGGSGKSMMMRHFFVDAIVKERGVIPIFVELRDLTRGTALLDVMYESVSKMEFPLEKEYFEYALRQGKFVILLDAYDEIPDNADGRAYKAIMSFCETYNKNAFIMSSRPYENFKQWELFTVLSVSPLDKDQACSLIERLKFEESIKTKFLDELRDKLYESRQSFASIPLLLNIMLLTYGKHAEIPEKVHLFYENAFRTLFDEHDASKGAYKREHKCKLPFDDFKNALAEFCYRTYIKSQTAFSQTELLEHLAAPCKKLNAKPEEFLEDLSMSVCVMKLDGYDNYTFTHRSFQEYFTAVHLKNVPDDRQIKACNWLIEHEKIGEAFWILYDINTARVEKNIIMPYLKELFARIENKKESPIVELFFLDADYIEQLSSFGILSSNEKGYSFCTDSFACEFWEHFEPNSECLDTPQTDEIDAYYRQTFGYNFISCEQTRNNPVLMAFIEEHSLTAHQYHFLRPYYDSLLEKQKAQQEEDDLLLGE